MNLLSKHGFSLFLLTLLLAFSACEKLDFENDIEGEGEGVPVTVKTRSVSDDVSDAPVHVYAFDAQTGQLFCQQASPSISSPLALSLEEGRAYHIVAVAADEAVYELPDAPSLTSVIKFRDNTSGSGCKGYTAEAPLQMGYADVTPTASGATVHIQLNYQACLFNASLSALPAACVSAYVSVSVAPEGVSLAGELEGSSTARIPCTLQDGSWSTGDVYIFPTSGSRTTFSIAYNDADGEVFSSATYQSRLVAGVPYNLSGTYVDGSLSVSGSITPAQWADPVNLTFFFDDGSDTDVSVEGEVPGDNPADPSSIPLPCSVWNGHVVAAVMDGDGKSVTEPSEIRALDSVELLLVSLDDWDSMTSANNEIGTKALNKARSYVEQDVSEWSIPTSAQARLLMAAYDSGLVSALSQAGAYPIILNDGTEDVRYLCDDAVKTFSFKTKTISTGGTKKSTYHLRLVSTVKVDLK